MSSFFDLKYYNGPHNTYLKELASEVIDSGVFILGQRLKTFEKRLTDYIGVNFAIGTGSGFDALKLIFRALIISGRIRKGDEAIVPANTYIATIMALFEEGLTPVLVEPDINTYNIDISNIERHITGKTSLIVPVHLYGRLAWSEELVEIINRYGLVSVEDNAQAFGASCLVNGDLVKSGALADAAAFSFYPTKNLGALGDGGAVTTKDQELTEIIRGLRNYGSTSKNLFKYAGINSRLDEIQAAFLVYKLGIIDYENQLRDKIASSYLEGVSNELITLPSVDCSKSKGYLDNVWHQFVVRTDKRDKLREYLFSKGIETLIHYPVPVHKQECFSNLRKLELPVTEEIHRTVLSLPMAPYLDEKSIYGIIEAVNDYKC